jgi:hypothetical protein
LWLWQICVAIDLDASGPNVRIRPLRNGRSAKTSGQGPETSPGHRRKEEVGMRKLLLASVAALGTGGLIGSALAQAPVVGAPTQGQQAFPPAPSPPSFTNNNNNNQAPALPGALANPTPGTIVIHGNGKVQADFQGAWTR